MLCGSLQELADHFQRSRNTIINWSKKWTIEGPPYDTDVIVAWRMGLPGRKQAKANAPVESEAQNYKNAIERGELVHVADTEQALLDQATIFAT